MQNREEKVEVTLFFIAISIAVFLRFMHLGSNALGDSEASAALQAFHLAKGEAASISGQSGYVSLTTILFYLFEANNFWARFWPALFGSLLVMVPLLYKNWLGKRPTLLLAFLLAVEPGLAAISRTAGGEMIAITCLAASFGFYLNHKSIMAGIAAGLALLAGTFLWTGLLTLGIALIVFNLLIRKGLILPNKDPFQNSTVKILLAGGVTIGLIGTLFGTTPSILSGLGSGVGEFIASFGGKTGIPIGVLLLGLPLTQVLVIPLAIWGIVAASDKYSKLTVLMILWSIFLFAVTILQQSRNMLNWGWLLIPLNTLAVIGLEAIIEKTELEQWKLSLVQAAATFALILFSFFNLISLVSNPSMDNVALRNQVLAVLLPIAMIFVVTMLIGWGWSFIAAKQGLILGIGSILILVTIGNAWKAAGLGPRPEAELWRIDSYPVGEDLLVSSVKDISLYSTGETNGIDVKLTGLNEPSLLWAFHTFSHLKSEDLLSNNDTSAILVSRADSQLSLNNIYRGQAIKWKSQIDFEQMNMLQWIKWFATRTVPLQNENLLLWARNDLFKGSTQN